MISDLRQYFTRQFREQAGRAVRRTGLDRSAVDRFVQALVAFPPEGGQAEALAAIFDQFEVAEPLHIGSREVLGERDAKRHASQREFLVRAERRSQSANPKTCVKILEPAVRDIKSSSCLHPHLYVFVPPRHCAGRSKGSLGRERLLVATGADG